MSNIMVIYRGLPGSGKTTQARAAQRSIGGVLVGRDHIREALWGLKDYPHGDARREALVSSVQEKMIREAVKAGMNVLVDDMNLRSSYVKRLTRLADSLGIQFVFQDLTNIHPDACVVHDRNRERSVGEAFIRDQYNRFVKGKTFVAPESDSTPIEPYQANLNNPLAVIVDIDGTVALMDGRSPYDYSEVGDDLPNLSVISLVHFIAASDVKVIFVSGRPDSCRRDTEKWLEHYFGSYENLFMRKTGDNRDDTIVKREIFDQRIRHYYDVTAVFDDRDRVVDMWRSLGLTCLQVAPGAF